MSKVSAFFLVIILEKLDIILLYLDGFNCMCVCIDIKLNYVC